MRDEDTVFNKCTITVTSQCTGLGTVFFNETINRDEPGGSHTNADFYAEFDVDYPYMLEHEYALDIELFLRNKAIYLKFINYQTMRNATFLRKMLWLLCLPLLFIACKDNMDEHYEVPDWVADNAWEVLSSSEHGNYSIFLQGVEIAGFKQMLEGKAILTIMAPDDSAFQAYLSEKRLCHY